jgi:hypothetical protein
VDVPNFGGAGVTRSFSVPSWRGIENPFGHIWKWLDGYNLWVQTAAEGGKSLLYFKNTPTGLVDDTSVGYTLAGELPRAEGWVKSLLGGHLFPAIVGGAGTGSTTYWCDYFYTNAATSWGWRAPFVGGNASSGSTAGLVCVNTHYGASSAATTVGSRLCFLGA